MGLRALRRLGAVVVGVCLLAGSVLAYPINIDTFDADSHSPVVSAGTTVSGTMQVVNPAITQTVGGVRSYTVTGTGSGIGATMLLISGGQAGLGTLTMASTYSGQWTLSYGYSMSSAPADMNLDLVGSDSSPNTDLLIKMVLAEYDYDLAVTVTTDGHGSTASFHLPANATPQDVVIPFSSFTSVDFHDVDQISFQWTGRPNGDYVVDAILASTPEPATVALVALGAVFAISRMAHGRSYGARPSMTDGESAEQLPES